MSKPRVYEIAKDINISSKDIMGKLEEYGVNLKNHMSTMEDREIDIVLEIYTQMNDEGADSNNANNEPSSKDGSEKAGIESEKLKQDEELKEKNAPDHKGNKGNKGNKENKEETLEQKDNVKKNEADFGANNKPDDKKTKYYDTRPNLVESDKIDDEEIEKLLPDKIKDEGPAKQKIKKGVNKGKREVVIEHNANKLPEKPKEIPIEVIIPDEITVGELAEKLKKPVAEIIKKLISVGIMATMNQFIDFDTASLIAEDFGATVEKEIIITDEDILFNDTEDEPSKLKSRSPVVVVMGHVDHGKTSLLDAIREANVIATEAGGITQHVGAYRVNINNKDITFLDTPGHAAFTAMRARGAQVTDIAILVVAADDGVMPQTIEAINHAKAANLNIIVAINKMDKEGANPDRVKQELTEHGLVTEEWGGDTICVPVSAINNTGIEHLLEMILLVAEMHELKANPDRMAKGTIIEAELDKGKGPVATLLVQNGTLNTGDIIVAGTSVGRIRAMVDDKGKKVHKAGPSVPVVVLGLSEVPEAGNIFYAVKDERKARNIVEKRKHKQKEEKFKEHHKVSLEDLFEKIKEGETKELNIIIKADVQGSVEALRQSLEKLSDGEVKVRTIHAGVGAITESDVMLATASNAIIIGFNVRPDAGTQASADMQEVEIRLYRVIYNAIEEVEAAMKGLLDPTFKENILGHAEIRATFKVTGVGTIAGCYVTDGKINRNSEVRVVRDGIVIHEGTLNSLKRFKDDAKEVSTGYECGIGIERFNDIKEGDIIECFVMEEVKR